MRASETEVVRGRARADHVRAREAAEARRAGRRVAGLAGLQLRDARRVSAGRIAHAGLGRARGPERAPRRALHGLRHADVAPVVARLLRLRVARRARRDGTYAGAIPRRAAARS